MSFVDVPAVSGRLLYPSDGLADIVLPAVAATQSLPSVVVSLPSEVDIARIIAALGWRKQVDSSGAVNRLDGDQQIQVRSDAPGTWTDAIKVSDNALHTDVSATEGGLLLFGTADLIAEVDESDTYEFQWLSALVDGASLTLYDVQTFLIVEFL